MPASIIAPTTFFNCLACSRRKPARTCPASTAQEKDTKRLFTEAGSGSDSNTCRSTEAGHFSSNEWSDHSELLSASDSELTFRPPSGFAPPPGLEAPIGSPVEAESRTPLGTRLNSQAALFVPGNAAVLPTNCMSLSEMLGGRAAAEPEQNSQQLRQSIRCLKGALEEWEANMPDESGKPWEQQQDDQSAAPSALLEALSRLTPVEAASVRTFLDAQSAAAPMPVVGFPAAVPVGIQFPAAVPMTPPPGMFCHNPCPTMGPGQWMQPPRTSFGVKQQRVAKGTKLAPQEESSQSMAETDTLRTNLRDLSACDPARVLMVRKINRLGLNSPALLEAYFSKFGVVERVMVSHSRAKSLFGRGNVRVRPAGLGFLIMASAEAVEAALRSGKDHDIQGAIISASRFESRELDGGQAEDPQVQ